MSYIKPFKYFSISWGRYNIDHMASLGIQIALYETRYVTFQIEFIFGYIDFTFGDDEQ